MGDKLISDLEQKLKSLVEKFKKEIGFVRTNRPNTQLLEEIKIDYFGQFLTLKQLASISLVLPREIRISVWDRNALGNIVKAIKESGLGLNPVPDGQIIRINIPSLTEERRQEFVRLVKKMTEESRIRVRNFRDEIMKELKKLKDDDELSEDQEFKLKDRVQKVVDGVNKEMDNFLNKKIIEINE